MVFPDSPTVFSETHSNFQPPFIVLVDGLVSLYFGLQSEGGEGWLEMFNSNRHFPMVSDVSAANLLLLNSYQF